MKQNLIYKIVLATILTISFVKLSGQEFECINTEQGLSSNDIFDIAQDSVGQMWFASHKGLSCFNGYTTRTYLAEANDSTSLIDNHINSICYTSKGELLIGTSKGLSIYNFEQDNFTNFNFFNSRYDFQSGPYINDVEEDENGNIWVATSTGLYKFNKDKRSFIRHFRFDIFFYLTTEEKNLLLEMGVPLGVVNKISTIQNSFYTDKKSFLEKLASLLGEIDHKQYSSSILKVISEKQRLYNTTSITTVTFDDYSNIWLGLSYGHIIRIGSEDKEFKIAYINDEVDFEHNIYSLVYDEGLLYVGTIKSGFLFDTKKWEVKTHKNSEIKNVIKRRAFRTTKAGSDILWFGSGEGIVKFNKTTGKIQSFKSSAYNSQSLTSDKIEVLFIDKQNQLWAAAAEGGICKLKTIKNFKNYNRTKFPESTTKSNRIESVLVDKDENIWIGYYSNGIDVYNKSGEVIKSFHPDPNTPESLGSGSVNGLVQDLDGVIWVCTYFGNTQYYDPKTEKFINFNLTWDDPGISQENHGGHIICDKYNNLWLNSPGKGFYKISSNRKIIQHFSKESTTYTPGLSSNWVSDIYTTPSGNILYSIGDNAFIVNESLKTISPIISTGSLGKRNVTSFFEDNNKNLYIGTISGLFLVRINDKEEPSLFSHPILSGYTITNILQDAHSNLWVSSDNGIFKITIVPEDFLRTKKVKVRQYLMGDGLPYNNFSHGRAFKTKDGMFLFGSDKGFTFFHPDSIKDDSHQPHVIFTDFKIYNQSISPGTELLKKHISQTKEIVLPYDQNFISFEFAALDFVNPTANQYAYKMEGFDKNWNYIGNKREANYTKMPHGKYVFMVKATNNDGIWNETPISIQIEITPPFWKTNLAFVIYFLIISGILIVFMIIVRNREKFKADMKLDKLRIEKDNELTNMKLRFFTNISHEFRTPLTLMLGPLESIIQKGKSDISQINLIYRNAQKLSTLMNQILDIRKIDSGKMKLKREILDIADYTEKLVGNFKLHCQKKDINLNFRKNIASLENCLDIYKYETIVSNLLSNAITHTPKGGSISVELNLENNGILELPENHETFFSLSVKDSGSGISDDEKDDVFERFYQSKNNKNIGSGIGLTLVKEFTELHGGKIKLESKLNEGAKFTVILPVTKPNSQEVEKAKEVIKAPEDDLEVVNENLDKEIEFTIEEEDSQLPLVLVVEDNDEIRNYTVSEIRDEFRIIEAENGKKAIDLAFTTFPDLIISDIMMPEMDGIEMSKVLKTDEKTSHIPIILLTAYGNEKTNVEGYKIGADDFIVKPFSPKVLKTRIKNILDTRTKLKEKFSNILYSVPSSKSINKIDEQFLKNAIKIVEDNLMESKFNIDFLCREMGFSRTAFYSKVKTLTNQSISEFIKLIRLKKSIELFREGQKTINEVAFLVGFKTHSHFSRCFQEEFEMSPSEYISKIKENKT